MSKTARRALILFAAAVALLCFFSSSLRYWMTPKVTVASVTLGTILRQRTVSALHFTASDTVEVKASPYLPDGLKVAGSGALQERSVSKGEKLLELDTAALDMAILDAREAYMACLVYQTEYRRGLEMAQETAQEKLNQAETALNKVSAANVKRKAQLERAYQTAQEDYDLIVTQGIYGGATLETVAERTRVAEESLAALEALRDAGYALVAPCDGLLVAWPREISQDMLRAGQRYFEMIPDRVDRQLTVALEGEEPWPEQVAQVSLVNAERALDKYSLIVADKRTNEQGAVELVLEGDAAMLEKLDLTQRYTLAYESDAYQALVPNAAFITADTVYVVTEKYVDGRREQIVQEAKVQRGEGNAAYTPVSGGVQAGDRVVTSWDRPLKLNQRVIVLAD